MGRFYEDLKQVAEKAIYNDYGLDNYDAYIFGPYTEEKPGFVQRLKNQIKKIIGYDAERWQLNKLDLLEEYYDRLQFVYERLDEDGRELLVNVVAYRIFGHKKVKLPLNNPAYWKQLDDIKKCKDPNDTMESGCEPFVLERFRLEKIGIDADFYFLDPGVVIDFIYEQYAYKKNGKYLVQAEAGDNVLDFGACWGDTAIYFANKVGDTGKVFSFEFLPTNISIFHKNLGLNPRLQSRVELIRKPVSDRSGKEVFYEASGPGSRISANAFEGFTGKASTISIDDFVRERGIEIDFIKMDIEGEELNALKGGIETIRKYRPKLAIAIYHSMDDLVNIPKWLMELDLGYKFYLGHYTIHAGETVIYATVEK